MPVAYRRAGLRVPTCSSRADTYAWWADTLAAPSVARFGSPGKFRTSTGAWSTLAGPRANACAQIRGAVWCVFGHAAYP
eukprot:11580922-Alexandrium_andersonii.AAC.1